MLQIFKLISLVDYILSFVSLCVGIISIYTGKYINILESSFATLPNGKLILLIVY